ncbi:MAG: DUF3016 domain-containing protein [Verrucomicrobiota bacterium]
MNTKAVALLSLATALIATNATVAKPIKNDVDVSIDFERPEKFTDIEAGALTTEKEQEYILSRISDAFTDGAKRYLPNGYSIEISVNDVDLAGAIEPWQYRYDDVRIMREIYPPRLKFDYAIRDANNEIVSDGYVNLKDYNYLLNPLRFTSQERTAFHVTSLVKDWLKGDVGRELKDG